MFQKIKDALKKDLTYWIISFGLMIITLVIAAINYSSTGDFSINLPWESTYGIIVYPLIIVLGLIGIFIFRKADNEKVKLENLFLCLIIPIGIIMCLATPLGRVPDEPEHAKKAVAISNGNLFSVADENGNATDMFNAKINEVVSRSTATYKDSWEKMNLAETEDEIEMNYNTQALYAPICHMPQAIGILITRILGGGITIQMYMGRLFNFAIAVFLIYKAIKFMPSKKYLILLISMLPVSLNILPTMSADTLTLAMSLFYVAYILHLKYDESIERYSKKQKVILVISTIVISLCKIVYVPMCLLLLVLPKEKFKSFKNKNVFVILTILISVILNLVWLAYCTRFLIEFNYGVNSKEQIIYILTNPIDYIIILCRTINFSFNTYIAGLCGDALGIFCVKASEIFIYICTAVITILFFANTEEKKIKFDLFTKIIFGFIFVSIVLLIYTSLYVQWTPVKTPLIHGVQPRYFLPILLLTAIVFDNDKFIIKEKIEKYLLTFLLFFNLNVATATIYTYYFGMLIDRYIK